MNASAWIYKQHSEALGRNFKVQDTNTRAMTGIAYRGAATCTPLNYTQITQQKFVCGTQCNKGTKQTLK